MAYYDSPKCLFDDLIKSVKNKTAKAYLKYKRSCWYCITEKNAYIEQWLYNQDCDEICTDLHGFVAGFNCRKMPFYDVDYIMAAREIIPYLGKIYIEISKENNWGTSANLKDWKNAVIVYGK